MVTINEELPQVPEFTVTRGHDEVWVATRKRPLTRFQLSYGCQRIITASTFEELEVIACAERMKADLVGWVEDGGWVDSGDKP